MLVAVMTKKLALNKGEKHVHFFMMDIQISKRIRHAAANVLRECWLLHRTNLTRGNSGEHRRHQRCLLEAIRVFRHLRLKQRKLRDYASEMVDLPKMQMIMCDLSANWNNSYAGAGAAHHLHGAEVRPSWATASNRTSELLAQALRHLATLKSGDSWLCGGGGWVNHTRCRPFPKTKDGCYQPSVISIRPGWESSSPPKLHLTFDLRHHLDYCQDQCWHRLLTQRLNGPYTTTRTCKDKKEKGLNFTTAGSDIDDWCIFIRCV
ncbi:uncharacterized protein [Salvelinus sp. IW2-2015]|uniref:uncharacterized protein n=1 Tax=Salvelinus sp. IW2-2015 TaxID=2691554 RepID=UPI000CEA80C1|nr:uncharacterized protein LOC112072735 [Salvelinus alpinus]